MAQKSSLDEEIRAASLHTQIVFAPEGGFYTQGQQVELHADGAEIYYTLDGSRPQRIPKHRYTRPISIKQTSVIRAMAYRTGEKNYPTSHTYFINEPKSSFPVVSIAVTPELLFDIEKGLFMEGKNVKEESKWKKYGANFWSKKEIAVNTEFYELDGQCKIRQQTGLRLFGGMSRLSPQKSLTIVSRSRYGSKRMKHEIFGENKVKKHKFVVLRNSGSDFGKSHFRDAFMTGLLDEWDIETQDCRPANVYINGEYWGIYNIREKINRYFLNSHFDVDKDSLDLMEHRLALKRGSSKHYVRTIKFLLDNDLRDPRNYAYIKSRINVENFMEYKIAQIYFDNEDAGGNIKYWRPQTPDGKWRWILYDTDWGFGLHEAEAYKNNSIAFHTKPDGENWPNPAWSTFILRKLLENSEFKRAFLNRFSDYLNTTFEKENVIAELDKYIAIYEQEMPRHLERWRLSDKKWREQLQVMRDFGENRPVYLRTHLKQEFNLGEMNLISLVADEGGKIILNNNVKVKSKKPFSGWYFNNVPITIQAKPRLGYRFVGWVGAEEFFDERELTLYLVQKHTKLKAVFEKYDHPLANKIIINEINANNKKAGDWVEIYNRSESPINLKGWTFVDSKNKFKMPSIDLPPKDYIVLCEDERKFGATYPDAYRFYGNLGFGLSKRKEELALFDPQGAWVDSVAYVLPPTDSVFTLNLLLPHLDNSDLENWEQRTGFGTPCAANPYYVESTLQGERDRWMQIGGAIGIIILCVLLLFFRTKRKI